MVSSSSFFFPSFFSYNSTVLLPVLLKSLRQRLDCQQLWGASELKEQERRWKRKNAKVDSRVYYPFGHQTSDRYSACDTFTEVLWNVRAVCLVSSHHFLDKLTPQILSVQLFWVLCKIPRISRTQHVKEVSEQ